MAFVMEDDCVLCKAGNKVCVWSENNFKVLRFDDVNMALCYSSVGHTVRNSHFIPGIFNRSQVLCHVT